jgi:hypothetical protein
MPAMRHLLIGLSLTTAAHAGHYPANEKSAFEIRPDGTAAPLSFGTDNPGVFNLKMAKLADFGDLNPARKNNADRDALKLAVEKEQDPTFQAADYLRLRNFDAALNRLAPLARSRNPSFTMLATLAHAHALRGEWSEAVRWHESARLDADFPAELPGHTVAQTKWVKKVEFEYYTKWLSLKRDPAKPGKRLPAFQRQTTRRCRGHCATTSHLGPRRHPAVLAAG